MADDRQCTSVHARLGPLAALLLLTPALAGCFDSLPLIGTNLPDDYLSDEDYDRWVIEVDYVQGHRPDDSALSLMKSRMQEMVRKDTIEVIVDNTLSGRETWDDAAIRGASAQHQDRDHGDGTLVTHVLYLDGSYSKGQVLGVTYGDKELVAIFEETINGASNLVFSSRQIERAVLVHEFGHVIGLVNTGTPMVNDHEDDDHPGHSDNRNSVMYWAVETTDITRIFTGGIPTEFDSDDKADACNAGGRC